MKQLNWDIHAAAEQRKLQLCELDELRLFSYENARIYKERTKHWHDNHIQNMQFNPGQLVLLQERSLALAISVMYHPLIENVCLVENLKHNLLSISQLCDKCYKLFLIKLDVLLRIHMMARLIFFIGNRYVNIYAIDIDFASTNDECFSTLHDDGWLWYRRLGHASMDLISKISKNDLVKVLLKIDFQKDKIGKVYQFGKQIKTSFKNKNHISTSKPLQLLHMDLFGPSRYASLSGKYYSFVIVDDYSIYTRVLFLANKDDVFDVFRVIL